MKNLNTVKKAILKNTSKLNKLGLTLNLSDDSNHIRIGSIDFYKSNNLANFQQLEKNKGLLLAKSPKELRKSFQEKHINYFDYQNGCLFISIGNSTLLVETGSTKGIKRKEPINTNIQLSPTNLISPNGFAFLDVLFRLEDSDLLQFSSVLRFCKQYDLYQPKVSQIMKKFNSKTVLSFKNKVRNIPIEWWLFALEVPASKRKMEPFFEKAQKYYSLDISKTLETSDEIITSLNMKYGNLVTPGPVETAKSFGLIIDDNISIWANTDALQKMKKEFKLIAGTKEGKKQWLLATSSLDIEKAGLLSHKPNSQVNYKTNTFRSLWDLGFGESRLREARIEILRKILK